VLVTAASEQEFVSSLERELHPLEDADEITVLVAQRLGEYLGADRCAYAQVEADEDHFTMSGDWASGLPHLTGRFAMSAFGAEAVAAMRRGESRTPRPTPASMTASGRSTQPPGSAPWSPSR
jgi:hypothetical protein